MTFDEIKQLVETDESRHLEFKKTTGELKDGMHSAIVPMILFLVQSVLQSMTIEWR